MDTTLIDVKPEALEAGYAVLTGGRNLDGHPIISFPTENFRELQQYSTGDLLLLFQFYVKIAGPKVAILVDMRKHLTESDIIKVITAFDELQSERRGTITNVYIIKPEEKAELRVLKRCLLRKSSNGRLLHFYKVHLLESLNDIFNHVERNQLTSEFGGSLIYSHLAWVKFQRSFSTTLATANILKNKLCVVKKHTMKLRDMGDISELTGDLSSRKEDVKAKYERILRKHDVRETIFKCEDAFKKLENPDKTSSLKNVNPQLIVDARNKFKDILDYIRPEVAEMDADMSTFEAEISILAQLYECRSNTKEVKETISLLRQRIPESAIVGKDITEATNYRAYFMSTALEPSKVLQKIYFKLFSSVFFLEASYIVACATSILRNLDGGSKTTQRTYNTAFEIAKQLTQSIQPFTRMINMLNEQYTKIHVFHAVLEKMLHWKSKASLFIIRQLTSSENYKVIHSVNKQGVGEFKETNNDLKTSFSQDKDIASMEGSQENAQCNIVGEGESNFFNDTGSPNNLNETPPGLINNSKKNSLEIQKTSNVQDNEETHIEIPNENGCRENVDTIPEKNVEYNTSSSITLERPNDWSSQLSVFYRKHPPPKKKHIRLLTKFEPVRCHRKLKNKSDAVGERTMFIISFLKKRRFKMGDIIRIQQWEMEDCLNPNNNKTLNTDACILEVTLV